MTIWNGTVSVTNGEAHVVVDSGPALSDANCGPMSLIIIDRVPYFVLARDSDSPTTEFDLVDDYEGATDTDVPAQISPVSEKTTNLVSLAQVVARLSSQLDIHDKNSAGIPFERVAATTGNPGAGKFAFNTDGDPDTITSVVMSDTDGNGLPVGAAFGMWVTGTILTVRSLNSAAYVYLKTVGEPDAFTGYHKVAVEIAVANAHGGDMATGEPYNIGFARVGQGLKIDKAGVFSGRSTYNTSPAGFVYASTNGDGTTNSPPMLYVKNTATSGDWGPGIKYVGEAGDAGWSPDLRMVVVSGRLVMKLNGYVGGDGSAPTENVGKYAKGDGTWVTNAADAQDFTGAAGASAFEVAEEAGFSGDVTAWLASLRGEDGDDGDDGDPGTDGADGTDPGILYSWDTATTDSNLGAGKMWANDVLNAADTLFVSKTNRAGDDMATWLLALDSSSSNIKGQLVLTRSGGNAQAAVNITVDGVDDRVGYVAINIATHSGAAGFDDADAVSLQFTRTGDKGTDGDGAGDVVGPSGGVVANEFALYDGTTGKAIKGSGKLYGDFLEKANNLSEVSNKVAALDNLSLRGTAIASAATTNLATATGDFVHITGTVTITAFGTAAAGVERAVTFDGALTLTHNSTSLILPGAADITTGTGDSAVFRSEGSGNWRCISYVRSDGQPLRNVAVASGGTGATTAVGAADALSTKGTNIASATTTNIASATGRFVHITGTTTITGLGTATAGVVRGVVFDGALTLTHNATSLILPGGANITTAAGDAAIFVSEGSGNWKCLTYVRAASMAATLAGSETLTNKTLTQPILTLEQGTSVAPTAEGRIAWDTDDNKLKVGDGSGTKTFSPDGTFTTLAGYGITDGGAYSAGTWTPTLNFGGGTTGIAYETRSGVWIRIRNLVFIWANVTLTNKGSSTGGMGITGYPYSPVGANYGSHPLSGTLALMSGLTVGQAATINQFSIYFSLMDGSFTAVTSANFTNSSVVVISGVYSV